MTSTPDSPVPGTDPHRDAAAPRRRRRIATPCLLGGLAGLFLVAAGCGPGDSGAGGEAPEEAAPILVTADWLEARLEGASGAEEGPLAILHVGSDSSFAAGHIPGARPLALARFAPEVGGLGTEMPDPADLRELLEDAGVSAESRVVIYSATHPPQFATRLYLTLEHFGLGDRASILDGGLRGWETDGRPMASGPGEAVPRGSLPELLPRGDLLVDHRFVSDRVEDGAAVVVDARDPQFWTGEAHLQARAERPGRIPGALNIPFRSLVDESGHFLDEASLRELFVQAGLEPGEPVVSYCHVGQQASLLAVAARLLGHPVRLYDGSWEDWSRRLELPAENQED
jgi:thiosulfate/3-mercaptopyruvate sulfurtransferase